MTLVFQKKISRYTCMYVYHFQNDLKYFVCRKNDVVVVLTDILENHSKRQSYSHFTDNNWMLPFNDFLSNHRNFADSWRSSENSSWIEQGRTATASLQDATLLASSATLTVSKLLVFSRNLSFTRWCGLEFTNRCAKTGVVCEVHHEHYFKHFLVVCYSVEHMTCTFMLKHG